ncbi:MAG: aldo/keto reductase [Lachnospiraceae bacterium]|nr:aldo/keto reductase [Lachnospiraceae bacterium]
MNYRKGRDGQELSILGFGCMRFKKKGNGFDMEEIEKELVYAVEHGVNYFDTAYIYSGSEEVLGTILEKTGLRDRINIATKLPQYLMKTKEDMEKHFAEQLKRLKTDHVDYYLMHMLNDLSTWQEIVARGGLAFLEEKKAAGAIRHIGFSFHGNTEGFLQILSAYDWDFCQIQYNYMDENSQAGRRGLAAAHEKGIPVIIMEPLRGGRLANDLPKDAVEAFSESSRGYSAAEWAFRWLWNQPEVSVVLSGMNSMEMLEENIRIASEMQPGSMTPGDFQVIDKVKRAFDAVVKVPCTGCGYCMPCPFGVDIPGCFRCLNVSYSDSYATGMREYFMCTSMKQEPSNAGICKKCGRCEQHCPQHIPIRESLTKVKRRFENPVYHIGKWVLRRIRA